MGILKEMVLLNEHIEALTMNIQWERGEDEWDEQCIRRIEARPPEDWDFVTVDLDEMLAEAEADIAAGRG